MNTEQFFQAVIQEENYDEAIATIKAAEISTSIKEIYLQLQNIVKNYRSDSKVSTNLSQLVDQLNWENQDLYIELIDEFLNDSSNFLNFKERYKLIVEVAKELDSNSISFKLNYLKLINYVEISQVWPYR